ncbi:MAG: M14 family zinc carboxypeptidase [Saprospiraceae bacterium]
MSPIKTLLSVASLLLSLGSFAQVRTDSFDAVPTYKRVSISNPSADQISALETIGVDLTCGAAYQNGNLQLELSEHTLHKLSEEEINYTVMIDDLSSHYQADANELPEARAELERLKANVKNTSETVLQSLFSTEACEEFNWPVPSNFHLNPNDAPTSFGGCLTYAQVLQELDNMRALYPNLISERLDASPSNQTTLEGRTIHYIRISDNPDIDEANEPETLYQSLIHSREPSSLMQLLYFMWYVLENYQTDQDIQNLVNNQALYFIPVFNPDGFVYNETVSPNGGGMQRKNRNVTSSCDVFLEGIDLNRNSAYYWGNGGSSDNECSNIFLGSGPFSENETQIMRDFFLEHDFKLALNHHSFKNAMLHAYAGTNLTNPRPDEYAKYNHDMTEYNRYAYGPSTSISSLNSGNMNDWMLGGPAGMSSNGTPTGIGSGKNTMAWTPENGTFNEGGFWPSPFNFVSISKRAMRMNFLAAFYSGKFAKLHDLNQSEVSGSTGELTFEIENLGQTSSNFEVSVTALSSNILTVSPPMSLTGMNVLQQEALTFNYSLNPNTPLNDTISFLVHLSNDNASNNVLASIKVNKVYQPDVLVSDNPDSDGLSNWTSSGGDWHLTADAYSGTAAITTTLSPPYANNESKYLALNTPIDLSAEDPVVIQYYGKWDLERSFDYVQLEASYDGLEWIPLCGRLTKPGAPDENNTYSGKSAGSNRFQPDGSALYDGDTNGKWNMEEIVIDEENNASLFGEQEVFLRFQFQTDESNSQDAYYNANFEGFTFDDFKCTVIGEPLFSSVSESNAQDFKLYPNPIADQLTLDFRSATSPTRSINIVDMFGRSIYRNENLTNSSLTIDTKDWSPGLYLVDVCGVGRKKIVKQ